jgi:hypothetical protein
VIGSGSLPDDLPHGLVTRCGVKIRQLGLPTSADVLSGLNSWLDSWLDQGSFEGEVTVQIWSPGDETVTCRWRSKRGVINQVDLMQFATFIDGFVEIHSDDVLP